MSKKRERPSRSGTGDEAGLGGILRGLGGLVEQLGELAETGRDLSRTGEFGGPGREMKGVYGFTVKVGLGGEESKVQPFGNIRRDETLGRSVVHEAMEPALDLFEEADHVLLVAEMPGIAAEDVQLAVTDTLLTITAEHGDRKYRKEVRLPRAFRPEQMQISCTNGVLEIRCAG